MLESDVDEDILFDVVGRRGEDEQLLKNSKFTDEKPKSSPWGTIKKVFTGKSHYPSSVFFILGTEFCERFSYYGLRTILVLYLTQWLSIGKNRATAMFHGFSFLAYFSPVFGAVIADSFLGRYRTILYVSAVYGLGCAILSLTALPPPELPGPLIGLFLISLGTGGIKPCVVTFGGDQFTSDQEKVRNTFFSLFYLMINLGSLISTFLTPVLRADVHCFQDTCYPLAFGVPALLMFTSVAIFFAGRHRYKHVPPTGSLFTKVFKCILHGIRMKCKYRKYQEGKSHWLEYAGDQFEMSFIDDVKRLLKVLWLFLPLPIFWALYNQQGSRWTLQAAELDGRVGAWRLKPDQLQALNPLLIIILIPVFEKLIYPLLDCCRIPNSLLQRMVAGMTFVALAFVLAGLVQIKIDAMKDPPLSGKTGYVVLNAADCPVHLHGTSPFFEGTIQHFQASSYQMTSSGLKEIVLNCEGQTQSTATATVEMEPNTALRLIVTETNDSLSLAKFADRRVKSSDGQALVSIAVFPHLGQHWNDVRLVRSKASPGKSFSFNTSTNTGTDFQEVDPGDYRVAVPAKDHSDNISWVESGQTFALGSGGVYTIVLRDTSYGEPNVSVAVYATIQENTLSMFYMVPQYVIITIGEILFSISGLGFAYAQAPQSMRSVVQAAWLLTTAFGDLIVVIVAEVRLLPNQMSEFFLFAGLMIVDLVVFAIMAAFFKSVKTDDAVSANGTTDNAGLINSSLHEGMPLQDKD